MSKWNRPMRSYRPASVLCRHCGKEIRMAEVGWEHVGPPLAVRCMHRDRAGNPAHVMACWHLAQP